MYSYEVKQLIVLVFSKFYREKIINFQLAFEGLYLTYSLQSYQSFNLIGNVLKNVFSYTYHYC